MFKVEQISKNKLICDMMDANVSVRIIEDVGFECGNVLVLNSQGPAFEPCMNRMGFETHLKANRPSLGKFSIQSADQ